MLQRAGIFTRAYHGTARAIYKRFSQLPVFRDLKINISSDTGSFINLQLGVPTDASRLALRHDFPSVLENIKVQLADLGHKGRTTNAEFPDNTLSVDHILRKNPIIAGIVDKALKEHGTEISGHDSPHIRAVINRAVAFAEHYNKAAHRRIDLPLVIVCAAVHDLGQTINGIGRKLHSTDIAGDAVVRILRDWNFELREQHPDTRYLSDADLMMARLCVTQHSLGEGKEADQVRIATINEPIVRIVTLADKSCGGGMPGVARCVLFSVRNNAPIFTLHEKPGDRYPSSETYVKNVLLKYIDHVKQWPEYLAVSHIIERQSRGMHNFIDQLRDESLMLDKTSNLLDPDAMSLLENIIGNIAVMLKSNNRINEIIHPQRVMITSLQIAHKYIKKHSGSLTKHDLLILSLAALLHNFWKHESGLWRSTSTALKGMSRLLHNAGMESDDIAAIFHLIDHKQLNLGDENESIFVGNKISESLLQPAPDFKNDKKMRIMSDILADAETIAKNFGAHGVVYNIYESYADETDNDTILFNFSIRMLRFLADLQPIKLHQSVIVAGPLTDFTVSFLNSAREEKTCKFDPDNKMG